MNRVQNFAPVAFRSCRMTSLQLLRCISCRRCELRSALRMPLSQTLGPAFAAGTVPSKCFRSGSRISNHSRKNPIRRLPAP
jgi:hypothetical protein